MPQPTVPRRGEAPSRKRLAEKKQNSTHHKELKTKPKSPVPQYEEPDYPGRSPARSWGGRRQDEKRNASEKPAVPWLNLAA